MSDATDMDCRRRCWIAAAVGGVLVAALLRLIAHYPLVTALFFGLMFLVLFGGFIVWAFCTGKGQDMARTERLPERALQPRPVAAPTPRPEPVRAPESEATAPAPAPQPAAPMVSPVAAAPAAPAVTADLVRTAPAAPAAKATAKPRAAAKPKAEKPAPKPVKAAKSAAPAAMAEAAPKAPAGRKAKAAPAEKPAKAKPARPSGLDAAMDKSKDKAAATATPLLMTRPRDGKGDDLKLIIGVGPKLEKLLNDVGVWHFDQIAGWKAKDIAFVDGKMEGFRGRISRDEWVKQAKILAKGGTVADLEKALGKG